MSNIWKLIIKLPHIPSHTQRMVSHISQQVVEYPHYIGVEERIQVLGHIAQLSHSIIKPVQDPVFRRSTRNILEF